MMKYTPRVRSETAPITSAASAETAIAAGQPIQALRHAFGEQDAAT